MILPKVYKRRQLTSLRGATLSRRAQWNHAHVVTPHFRPYSSKGMIQTVKGMKDVEGFDYDKFSYVTSTASKVAASFGYSNIMTNILEPEELFKRSLGQYSDIVNKEMYSFEDLGKRRLVLRPEGTAGVIRHLLNDSGKLHSLHKSNLKYFYQGPMYRYERPQAGRQRQFYQMGIENLCMNDSGPIHDLEIILLADTILKEIVPSQKDLVLEVNSLGSPGVMSSYNKLLVEYFTLPENWSRLTKQSQMRVENKNPLRVLDSKNLADQEVSLGSPKIQDVYDKESREKFEGVIKGLDSLGIKYQINPNLCRGLDYYEHTCFEYKYKSKKLGRSQNTILAGGRYDGLAQYLGHSGPISSVGWAAGIERLCLILSDSDLPLDSNIRVGVTYLIDKKQSGEAEKLETLKLSHLLKSSLPSVNFEVFTKHQKNIGKKLDVLFGEKNCDYVIMIGENEISSQNYILRDKTGHMRSFSAEDLITKLRAH